MAGWMLLECGWAGDNVTHKVVLGGENAGADECNIDLGHDVRWE